MSTDTGPAPGPDGPAPIDGTSDATATATLDPGGDGAATPTADTAGDTAAAAVASLEAPRHRRWRPLVHLWDTHPGVRSHDDLTLGERAADHMRNGMGSWAFVFGALFFLFVWMAYNRGEGFDPYPFILLNLTLSCLAAMQGAILLIAAKRADQISSELAQHDFETDQRAAKRIEEVHERLRELADHNHQLLEENNRLLKQLVDARA